VNRFFLAVLLSILCVAGCSSSKGNTTANSKAALPVVEVTEVVSHPLNQDVRLPGQLQAYESVAVFPKVSGFVEWIGVDRGSRVKAGQVMARLSAPELVSQRAEAQSRAQASESQLITANAKLSADEGTYQKLHEAAKTPGVVAGNDLLIAQKAMEADSAQVEAAKSNAQAARQAVQAVTATEEYLRITAPFDGVVTERNVHPGALVSASEATPMLRLESIGRLRLLVPLPESFIGAVTEGATIKFTVPAYPDTTFEGKVARISRSVDEKTRTMAVELEVDNKGGQLIPGQFADVRWTVHRSKDSMFVPSTAITTNLQRTFVIRIRDGKVEWADVKQGAPAGKFVEVFGDLKPGDHIAIRGTDELTAGQPVTEHVGTIQ
jgi:membrane fusion protein, multidrug efflux system